MAKDFKDGLLTFFEDITQATVGEEAIHGTGQRRRPQSMYVGDLNAKHSNGNLRKHDSRQSLKRSSTSSSATTGPNRQDSRSPLKKLPAQRKTTDLSPPIDVGGSFWRDNELDEPRPTTAAKVRPGSRGKASSTPQQSALKEKPLRYFTDEDGWDTWDTPPWCRHRCRAQARLAISSQAHGIASHERVGEEPDAQPFAVSGPLVAVEAEPHSVE